MTCIETGLKLVILFFTCAELSLLIQLVVIKKQENKNNGLINNWKDWQEHKQSKRSKKR